MTRAATGWLERHGRKPFFLFIHYFDPHFAYNPPEPFMSEYADAPYAGEIAYADYCLGSLIDKLKTMGLYNSSTIVITSDHGEGLDEHSESTHSFFIYQATMHVPLIIKTPGGRKDARINGAVSLIDVLPTILGLQDLDVPPHVQGLDLSPYVIGRREAEIERFVYGESLIPTMFDCLPLRGIVSQRWQYIASMEPELYDLVSDPGQKLNLADQQPDQVEELEGRIREMLGVQSQQQPWDNRQPPDEQSRARLLSLGYIGGTIGDITGTGPGMNDPKNFIAIYQDLGRVESLIAEGLFAEARRLCEEMLKENPEIYRTHVLLGRAADEMGHGDESIVHYARALELMESSTLNLDPSFRESNYEMAQLRDLLGRMLFKRGDFAEARVQFLKGCDDHPDDVRFPTNLGGTLVSMAAQTGSLEKRMKLIADAKKYLHRALSIGPENADIHNSLGAAYAMNGEWRMAEKHLVRAIEIDPDKTEAITNLRNVRANILGKRK